MGVFKNIVDGWSNYYAAISEEGLPDEVQALADTRAAICGECPELVASGIWKIFNRVLPDGRSIKQRQSAIAETNKDDKVHRGYKCGQCGCAFPQNVYAPEKKCPLGKW